MLSKGTPSSLPGGRGAVPSPPEPDDLRSMLTALTERIDAMVSAPSGPRSRSSSQPAVWDFDSAWLLGVAKVPPTAANDRARDFVGGATLPLIVGPPSVKAKSTALPKLSEPAPANHQDLSTTLNWIATALEKGKSSFEAGYGTDVCAAQSEEYVAMASDWVFEVSWRKGGRPERSTPPSPSLLTSPS